LTDPAEVKSDPDPASSDRRGLSPSLVGLIYCMLASFAYSTSNVFMTMLARSDVDPRLAIWGRETVTALVVGPYLLWLLVRDRETRPGLGIVLVLILVGLTTQVIGNISLMTALASLGMAGTIPTVISAILITTAVLGFVFLGERVTWKGLCAIALLCAAITVLGYGSTLGEASTPASTGPSAAVGSGGVAIDPTPVIKRVPIRAGIMLSCVAGTAFGLLTITVRGAMRRKAPKALVMVVITAMATIGLLPIILMGPGPKVFTTATGMDWWLMALGGVTNLFGFFFLNKGLETTSAVHASVTTSSQTAIAAVAGLFLLGEQFTIWLVIGVVMTIAGVVVIGEDEEELEASDDLS